MNSFNDIKACRMVGFFVSEHGHWDETDEGRGEGRMAKVIRGYKVCAFHHIETGLWTSDELRR